MHEIGEVREFATGFMVAVEASPGVCKAAMQTEQRVWDGAQWCAVGTRECAAILNRVCQSSLARTEPVAA
jgi:hypothetical protein